MRQRSSIKEILLCQHNLSKHNKYSLTTSEDHARVQMPCLSVFVPPSPCGQINSEQNAGFPQCSAELLTSYFIEPSQREQGIK